MTARKRQSKSARLPVPPPKAARQEVIAPGKLTRREWAKRINEDWDRLRDNAVDGFIQIGRDLHAAKVDLGKHGGWSDLLANDLKFNQRVAQMFMNIATWIDQKRGNASHLPKLLPPDYTTIDKLTRLDDATFQRLLDDGTICPTLPRNDVASLLSKINRQKKHQVIAGKAAALPEHFGPFPLIYADPPWRWDHFAEPGKENEKGKGRTPDQHYPTLTYDEIKDFKIDGRPISEIAHKDAALFLWCTSANILLAAQVMQAWGFDYSAHAVWVKDKTGLGLVFRNKHEVLLYGTRGNMPGPQYQPSSVFEYPRGRHSAKPPEIRNEIEKMFPDFDERTRLEVFARDVVPGWSVYGFEAFDRAAA